MHATNEIPKLSFSMAGTNGREASTGKHHIVTFTGLYGILITEIAPANDEKAEMCVAQL